MNLYFWDKTGDDSVSPFDQGGLAKVDGTCFAFITPSPGPKVLGRRPMILQHGLKGGLSDPYDRTDGVQLLGRGASDGANM